MLHPDSSAIRAQFPQLAASIHGSPPVYLDSACTTLRPEAVISAVAEHQRRASACHGRANHRFGRDATQALMEAREAIRSFLGARKSEEIVFVRNTTEAINLVANSFPFAPGDRVLTTELEHNSNLLPWQRAVRLRGIGHDILPIDLEAGFDLDAFRKALSRGVRLVSVVHVSNLCGIELPLAEICREAHRHGARVLVDGAQSVTTHELDLARAGVDFFAFSLHKMFGPSGIGVLYGKEEALQELSPFLVGGETVADSTYSDCSWQPLPARFEAGVANVDGAVGARAAVDFVRSIGRGRVREHVIHLNRLATEGLSEVTRLHLIGPRDPRLRGSIVNFWIEGIDSRGVARVLDEAENVMVRYGKHCVHPWFHRHRVPESVRASFSVYNTKEDVAALVRAVKNIAAMVG